ncbi:hypothetical protein CYY_004516 [Polysphondylium violaceum]|uniref:Uncharacterized protein n=1 Tax=Polysphondylium violaceum TaxID=133409 RepID=A0A8J4Q575_9MYCE|nr:hypothetical protein CYY_004516 [Polysphondylium violaceum]
MQIKTLQKICSISTSLGTQTCSPFQIYTNATHFGLKAQVFFTSNSSTHSEIRIQMTTTDSVSYTMPLVNPDGTPFTFKCENLPDINIFDSLLGATELIKRVDFYLTNSFRAYIKMNSQITKSLPPSSLVANKDYSVTFDSIDPQTILFTFQFYS